MSMRGYEGNKIKAEMQKVLRDIPMTPSEIGLRFKLDKRTVSNFLVTLKKYKIVEYHPDFCTGHVINRKYHSPENAPDFMELINEMHKTKNDRVLAKLQAKAQADADAENNPHVWKTVKMNDYHTKSSKSHKHEWRGYNSMAGV